MKTKELEVLKMRLKSGEYDGTHIMQAWLAIDALIKAKTKMETLREEFPLLDTPVEYHEIYCCEWSVNSDRKRLHNLLNG